LTTLDPYSEIKIRVQNNNINNYPSIETRADGPGGWFTIGTSSSDPTFYKTFRGLIEDTSYEIRAYNRTTVDGYSNSDVDLVNYSTDLMPRVDTPAVTAYSNGTDSVKFRIYNTDSVSATGDYEIYEPIYNNHVSGSSIKSGTVNLSGNDYEYIYVYGLDPDSQYGIRRFSLSADGYKTSLPASREFVTTDMPRVETPTVTAYSNGTDSVKFRIYNMDSVSATGDYEIYKPIYNNYYTGSLIKSGTVNLSGHRNEYIYVYGLDADSQYGIRPFSLSADGYRTSLSASREFVTTDDFATQWVYFATESSLPSVDVEGQYEASNTSGGEDYLDYAYPPSNYGVGAKASVPVAGSTNYYIYEAQ
jgi:hypothetical protein